MVLGLIEEDTLRLYIANLDKPPQGRYRRHRDWS